MKLCECVILATVSNIQAFFLNEHSWYSETLECMRRANITMCQVAADNIVWNKVRQLEVLVVLDRVLKTKVWLQVVLCPRTKASPSCPLLPAAVDDGDTPMGYLEHRPRTFFLRWRDWLYCEAPVTVLCYNFLVENNLFMRGAILQWNWEKIRKIKPTTFVTLKSNL